MSDESIFQIHLVFYYKPVANMHWQSWWDAQFQPEQNQSKEVSEGPNGDPSDEAGG